MPQGNAEPRGSFENIRTIYEVKVPLRVHVRVDVRDPWLARRMKMMPGTPK